ncbi:adenosylmethionine--8-amino-7-oxononanoate transaminase [Candidatus Saganbacteria bacterium]|nr:adenosylmethionine--8-amino-7-oxononanoate transaminase [Candidatus Saganbacteria bacterium]
MKKLSAKDKKYIWHPFTQMKDWIENDQLIIERGEGVYLFDVDGNKYLDGVSSLWVTVHGHKKKEINLAIEKQLNKVAHSTMLGISNVPAIELAERLVQITPKGLDKIFYSDSGSTAVEIALKIAFQYFRQTPSVPRQARDFSPLSRGRMRGGNYKTKFLTLVNAYHGDTIGSVSVGGMDLFHRIYKPLLFKTFKAQSPYCYRCRDNDQCPMLNDKLISNSEFRNNPELPNFKCLKDAENIMKKHHQEIAAMIVEPMVQAAAGMLTMPKGYLKAIRRLCTKYDILLICDEVATGFGRTGKMFACEHEGVSPDIMCVAKGLTGGYLPLAATLTSKKIFNAFLGRPEENKTFFHGHTYTGNPVACAAALASLDLFKSEKILLKMRVIINYMSKRLKDFYKLDSVGDIRQIGMMAGIELVPDKNTREEFFSKDRIGHKVILEARKRGVILRPLGNVIVLMPPLSISLKELKKLLDVTFASIEKITHS